MAALKAAGTAAGPSVPVFQTPVTRTDEGADRGGDKGNDEHLHHRVEPLLLGVRALGRAVGHGGGAVARLRWRRCRGPGRSESPAKSRRRLPCRPLPAGRTLRETPARAFPAAGPRACPITISPPARYSPTLSGESFSAAPPDRLHAADDHQPREHRQHAADDEPLADRSRRLGSIQASDLIAMPLD